MTLYFGHDHHDAQKFTLTQGMGAIIRGGFLFF